MDEQLKKIVEEAIGGSKDAFNKLLERYMKDILYFAKLRVPLQEAEDVAQEVSISMYRKIGKLRDPELFVQWMNAIVYNVSMNHLKKSAKQNDRELMILEESQQNSDFIDLENLDFIPENYVENEELRTIVADEISKLPDTQRVCLMYSCLQEFKRSEIAEITGLSPRQVSTGLNYGKKTLKERLEKRLGETLSYSFVPVGAVPGLTQIFQADQTASIPAALQAQVVQNCVNALNNIGPLQSLSLHAKTIGVAALGVAALSATAIAFALTSQEASTPATNPETQTQTPPAATQKEIQNTSDMIGAQAAATLDGFVANGAKQAQWQSFIKSIAATPTEHASEQNYKYTLYELNKQDKRLLIAEQQSLESSDVQVLYDFAPQESAAKKMTQFVLMFEPG